MAFGIDYVTAPPIAAMKQAGVTFVCRYLSEVNELTKIKLLTAGEAKALSQAGISIVSNYEWYASRATESHASGVQDAQIADSQHKACGGPADRPIYFSVDEDVDGSQCVDYFKGVASVIGLARTGAYGSYRVVQYLLNQGLIKWAWQTYAWSGGAWESRAHIQQYQNGVILDGCSVDYDRSMKPDFGQWMQGDTMIDISDVSSFFTAQSDTAWKCSNGNMLIGAILMFFRKAASPLALIGLPKTGEISVDGHPGVKIQVFERIVLCYDPGHVLDRPPGAGDVYAMHIDSATSPAVVQLLKVLGIQSAPQKPGMDLSPVIASLRDAQVSANEVTASIAAALKEVGISG